MTQCEICEEMGCNDHCDNCGYGNPCLDCEHRNVDCNGQCALPPPLEFFLQILPPTKTHQEKQVNWDTRTFYEPAELKAVRTKLTAHLAQHKPETPFEGPVRLLTKWCFPITGKHADGEYKTSAPDCDNMIKTFKDCCTALGYWKDDAQVASEITEKFWSSVPGIYVKIENL